MDDAGILTIVILVGGALVYGALQAVRGGAQGLRDVAQRRREHEEAARTAIEKRTVDLILEFPAMSDTSIADLLRDELINERVSDAAFTNWATESTVGRLRRTMLVELARAERRKASDTEQ